ncbi:MAG TPA: FAD-binding oxidoreductase [Alphaproteobacteria bacterium]|jgi:D-lactate dehydrogenase (cytochrome)|nr:FAD-binding oxidoreductase [Alphaproteobacteria bacterium]
MNRPTEPPIRDALRRIQEAVGPKGWTDEPAAMAPYLVEQRGLYHGRARLVVRPETTAEVAAVVGLCAEAGIPIVPQGGNTGLAGGGVPSERGDAIVLSLGRMNRIRALDPLNDTITVEAGVVLQRIQEAAAEADRLFPLSLGAEGSCVIGGNLSTNAGGTGVLRYGNARALVLGLEVVLPDGRVWDGLRGLRKDNTGYDLKQLFIGAEGTLGVITAAVLRLFPRPRDVVTAMVAVRDVHAAVELLSLLRAGTGEAVTAFELITRIGMESAARHIEGVVDPFDKPYGHYVLIECTSAHGPGPLRGAVEGALEGALERGLVLDAVFGESRAQAKALWYIREVLPEAQKFEGGSIKHDVAVPVSRVADFIAEANAAVEAAMPGIRPFAFGHVGDGNIHYNLSQPLGMDKDAFLAEWPRLNRVVHDIVVGKYKGSISAEHGIGLVRKAELPRYKSEVELDLMRRVKAALDPKGLMNPGKIF